MFARDFEGAAVNLDRVLWFRAVPTVDDGTNHYEPQYEYKLVYATLEDDTIFTLRYGTKDEIKQVDNILYKLVNGFLVAESTKFEALHRFDALPSTTKEQAAQEAEWAEGDEPPDQLDTEEIGTAV